MRCPESGTGKLLDQIICTAIGSSILQLWINDFMDILMMFFMVNLPLNLGCCKAILLLLLRIVANALLPSNYRPITCFPTLWKLFSFILSELIYSHLEENHLLPVEQKGCRKHSRGTKDQLLIDKLVMDIARHTYKNLHIYIWPGLIIKRLMTQSLTVGCWSVSNYIMCNLI